MGDEDGVAAERQGRVQWDLLTRQLHDLRLLAGSPSYAELVRRINDNRLSRGATEHAARIAKSSVHDAFRYGRSRINITLTREIVHAMGSSPSLVDEWVRQCTQQAQPTQVPDDNLVSAPNGEETAATDAPALPLNSAMSAMVLVSCIGVNLLGRVMVNQLHLPIYLDMVGTAIAAVALGPLRGATVGLLTNLVGVATSGWVSLDFAIVNVAGGLVWGYGVHYWHMGRTLARYFTLNVLVATACSLLAVPILLVLYGQSLHTDEDALTHIVDQSIHPFVVAEFVANWMTSLVDKVISGFVALVVVSSSPALNWRKPFPFLVPPERRAKNREAAL